jgi:aminoglycoside 3-N-acetyltransferase
MLSIRDLILAFRKLEIDRNKPVIAHASLSAFEDVRGGQDTMLSAVLSICDKLIMPTFTFKTMLIPEAGPENNGLVYGSGIDRNRQALFFDANMPADRTMSVVAEALRTRPNSYRSMHPILSFAGINAEKYLETQTLDDPFAPLHALMDDDGWVLLLGVDHTTNTCIHLAENLAGRKQFIRWALTKAGVVSCPVFPGCSNGFGKLNGALDEITHTSQAGPAVIRALPVRQMVSILVDMIDTDPSALLCDSLYCEPCRSVRQTLPDHSLQIV